MFPRRYSLAMLLCLVALAAAGSATVIRYDFWLSRLRERQADERIEQKRQASIKLERRVQLAVNEYPSESGSEPPREMPPRVVRTEGTIELPELGLVLRKVVFDPPVDGVAVSFFSEAEVTNAAYAQYLAETAKVRDDTAIEELVNLGRSTYTLLSTAAPSIHVVDSSSLWRHGRFPEGRQQHPVSFVTVYQAVAFCDWLDGRYELDGVFRLPKEDEWLRAAYGQERGYPWGDDEREWSGKGTEPVKARPHLRTPEGLYGMWGNVSELVLSPWNGYGGKVPDELQPFICQWLGTSYEREVIRGLPVQPRQDYWGYTHSTQSRSDTWGFRIVFIPQQ